MLRIIYVEDDPLAAAVVTQVLAAAGHRCLVIASARVAIETIKFDRPDMVIVDLGLPDVPGVEVVRAIRSGTGMYLMPILVLTGNLTEQARSDAMSAGANAVLTKAVHEHDFVERVEAVFRSNNLRKMA